MEALDKNESTKKKIVILGGGVSSMTTAIQLTDEPGWQDLYEITLYQMGWRLGGKGASGRNPEFANRIEEHGLHLWFGFYDNAFDLIQRCYAANNRPLNKPLATWQEAFKPYDEVILEEYVWGKWEHWPMVLPSNKQTPGLHDGELPTVLDYIKEIIKALHAQHVAYYDTSLSSKNIVTPKSQEHHAGILETAIRILKGGSTTHQALEEESIFGELDDFIKRIFREIGVLETDIVGSLILAALHFVESIEKHDQGHYKILFEYLEKILKRIWERVEKQIDTNINTRHLWIFSEFSICNIKGILEDGVITNGFDVINNMDYREWLKKHGCSAITLDSALVQAVYGLVFGGYKYFTFEAGTALRGALRMAFTYRGAVYYRMQAGMGDTIFGPMYEVLKARGVKFEFFHKVKNLQLNSDKTMIEAIEMGVQATIKGNEAYNPLYDVKGLPCWPSDPLYDQLMEGDELKNNDINLESYWTTWKDVGEKTLRQGVDYDIIVQGISIGALPVIAKELIEVNDKWKSMVKSVTACETQAFQLWFYPDLAGLGWPYWMSGTPLSGSYEEPFDTWADMSDLIIRESWPDNAFPNNIAYLCGPIETKVDYAKWDFNDPTVPQKAYEKVREKSKEFMIKLSAQLWPNATDLNGNFKWDLLTDIIDSKGEERFNRQWFRANIDPTELYVLSETNSSICRLKTDESGFNNMFITGDWIDNGFNAGCVEAAVIAGKQTARAILQKDFHIPGEHDNV